MPTDLDIFHVRGKPSIVSGYLGQPCVARVKLFLECFRQFQRCCSSNKLIKLVLKLNLQFERSIKTHASACINITLWFARVENAGFMTLSPVCV